MAGSWLVPWHPHPDERPVLLCLPPAGAGCGQFRDWQTALGPDISVVGVQLPGRESRWNDPEPASMENAVKEVVAELGALVPAKHPVTVFGHSFGALLGYDIVRSLRRERDQRVPAFAAAACRPPGCWAGAGQGLVDDDAELVRLLDTRGLDEDDLDEDTRELMLAVLRRDARLSLSFTGDDLSPVDCPLQAWGGEHDTTVSAQDLSDWSAYAAGDFGARVFPGGHYFCLDDPGPVLRLLRQLTLAQSAPMEGDAR